MKEPVGVVQLLDPFQGEPAPIPEGYRVVTEAVRPSGVGEMLRLAALVEREGARIVHAIGPRAWAAGVAAARLVRRRAVCTVSREPRDLTEALALRAADTLVTGVAAIAVDISRFKHALVDAPVIAFAGALRLGSGLLDLIEAVALVRVEVRDVRLLCA